LLEVSDLLLDIFAGYLPLYLSDLVGFTPIQTSLVLAGFMLANLAADAIVIPLLDRFSGRKIVVLSALFVSVLCVLWLMPDLPVVRVGMLFAIHLATLGWYPVLKGEAQACLPGRSGTVMVVASLAGLFGGGMAAFIGLFADWLGLPGGPYKDTTPA
jgi:MFS family permease